MYILIRKYCRYLLTSITGWGSQSLQRDRVRLTRKRLQTKNPNQYGCNNGGFAAFMTVSSVCILEEM